MVGFVTFQVISPSRLIPVNAVGSNAFLKLGNQVCTPFVKVSSVLFRETLSALVFPLNTAIPIPKSMVMPIDIPGICTGEGTEDFTAINTASASEGLG